MQKQDRKHLASAQNILYREATKQDILFLAKIRAKNSGTEESWISRISGYMDCTVHPQQALKPRIMYIVSDNDKIIGFIAGHLTRRFECDGELEWIDVIKEYRRNGIAWELVKLLAKWFIEQKAYTICVDPGNETARQFYRKNGAEPLNNHWMVWKDIRATLKHY
jgi:ribosomal protein S18 acetylase RimI-like enzyme